MARFKKIRLSLQFIIQGKLASHNLGKVGTLTLKGNNFSMSYEKVDTPIVKNIYLIHFWCEDLSSIEKTVRKYGRFIQTINLVLSLTFVPK